MQHQEGYFYNQHGLRIYYQAWLPEGKARAVMLVVHGLGEHSGRYAGLAGHFVALGYAVYSFDHVGHGRSEGVRQYVRSFAEFTETLAEYRAKIKLWQADAALFLVGHSMGGLIAAQHLLDGGDGVAGAVFSAPSIKANEDVSPAVIRLGKCLAVFAPKFRLLGLNRHDISRDPLVLAACACDPLMDQSKFTVRLGLELLAAMLRVQAQAQRLILPLLILQGGGDRIVAASGAQWFYDRAGSTRKLLKIYPDLYHEVFNEPERANVLKDMEDWLESLL